ncbi:hypothetical protein DRQ26_01045 [bacterium]|nr:MAG: hypothetical protein DRQ26_01045 [bacterium]
MSKKDIGEEFLEFFESEEFKDIILTLKRDIDHILMLLDTVQKKKKNHRLTIAVFGWVIHNMITRLSDPTTRLFILDLINLSVKRQTKLEFPQIDVTKKDTSSKILKHINNPTISYIQ